MNIPDPVPLYDRIYAVIRQIPPGKVAAYGMIARIVGRCTPRMVGYALAALRTGDKGVPWQRVVNSQGQLSLRGPEQREMLESEGVAFDAQGRIDLARFGWSGPDDAWLEAHGYDVLWFMQGK